jgi:flagellar export protein FliJ
MFRFRLERVLQHRQRRLDDCTLEAARAASALQVARTALTTARQELQASRDQTAARRQGRLRADDLTRLLAWHENLTARAQRLEAAVTAAARAEEAAQERLQAAWRDCEVLRRLEQRQRAEWVQQNERRERRILDEVGAIRAALVRRDPALPAAVPSQADRPRSAEGDRT